MSQLQFLDWVSIALGLALVVFLPLELWQRHKAGKLSWASMREMGASVSPLIPTILLGGIVTTFILWLFTNAGNLAPWKIPTTPITILACILLVDFSYYWDHRCGHRVNLYWSVSHSVHHSSGQYDQTTALRISAIDGFISPWFYTPVILIGFEPLLVGSCLGFILAYQQWIHTETIGKLGWFDRYFNSPSNHRVHHGSQPQYIDKNYGAILIIWDRIFGTYEPEGEDVVYGLITPLTSANPITVHISEGVKMVKELASATSWRKRVSILWRPPGYHRNEGYKVGSTS
jgi:sterol desaturase/sphingolipid hydroxylase (fatty acid hydroxylase superfamily)